MRHATAARGAPTREPGGDGGVAASGGGVAARAADAGGDCLLYTSDAADE